MADVCGAERGWGSGWLGTDPLLQPPGEVVGDERLDEGVELAVEHGAEVVEGQFDAVIGDAVLGEVVGADSFVAFAGADLGAALGGVFGVFLGAFGFEEAGAEDAQGLGLVFLLGAFVGAADDHAGGFVEDLDGGVGGVDTLAARSGGAADGDLEFVGFDFDVHLLGLGKDGHRAGAGVDAALGLGDGDALDAVDAAFVFEALVDVRAADEEDDLLETAEVGGTGVDGFGFPSPGFGVAVVHAKEVRGEEGGFLSAGTGADFHDDVAVVGGIGWKQAALEFTGEPVEFDLAAGDFFADEPGEFGVRRFGGQQFAVSGEFLFGAEVGVSDGYELLEAGVFAAEFLEAGRLSGHGGVAQRGFDLGQALAEPFDVGFHVHGGAACFTEPATARAGGGPAGRGNRTG